MEQTDMVESVSPETSDCEMEDEAEASKEVYLPGKTLQEGETLVCDESAYQMYHQAQTGAPCLSFDIVKDPLGDSREVYPLTCYIVSGTQGEQTHTNHVILMKMSNLHRTSSKEDDDEEESDSEDEDDCKQPELELAMIRHTGGVNRIRASQLGATHVCASWSEKGDVNIFDLSRPLQAVNDSQIMAVYTKNQESPLPLFSYSGHQNEGFALDWSPTSLGRLLTGDCSKNIHLWTPKEGGTWNVDQRPYVGHSASIEDIQWSPNEANVFASCSVDKSIRIWDARAVPSKACMLTAKEAHQNDINVISWNRNEPFIVSGGDDGVLKIWDLRQFQSEKPVALFKHHTAPVTSVEWHHSDSTVFAASGADDQITLWDLAIERDNEVEGSSEKEPEVPPQLLFIHQGQTDIKELHWHPQLPGVVLSTAHSGFNIFRTISV